MHDFLRDKMSREYDGKEQDAEHEASNDRPRPYAFQRQGGEIADRRNEERRQDDGHGIPELLPRRIIH